MAEAIAITGREISVDEKSGAAINSPALADLLKTDADAVRDILSQHVSPIDTNDLSIDEQGRVLVNNLNFANALAAKDQPLGTNFVCPGDGGIHL